MSSSNKKKHAMAVASEQAFVRMGTIMAQINPLTSKAEAEPYKTKIYVNKQVIDLLDQVSKELNRAQQRLRTAEHFGDSSDSHGDMDDEALLDDAEQPAEGASGRNAPGQARGSSRIEEEAWGRFHAVALARDDATQLDLTAQSKFVLEAWQRDKNRDGNRRSTYVDPKTGAIREMTWREKIGKKKRGMGVSKSRRDRLRLTNEDIEKVKKIQRWWRGVLSNTTAEERAARRVQWQKRGLSKSKRSMGHSVRSRHHDGGEDGEHGSGSSSGGSGRGFTDSDDSMTASDEDGGVDPMGWRTSSLRVISKRPSGTGNEDEYDPDAAEAYGAKYFASFKDHDRGPPKAVDSQGKHADNANHQLKSKRQQSHQPYNLYRGRGTLSTSRRARSKNQQESESSESGYGFSDSDDGHQAVSKDRDHGSDQHNGSGPHTPLAHRDHEHADHSYGDLEMKGRMTESGMDPSAEQQPKFSGMVKNVVQQNSFHVVKDKSRLQKKILKNMGPNYHLAALVAKSEMSSPDILSPAYSADLPGGDMPVPRLSVALMDGPDVNVMVTAEHIMHQQSILGREAGNHSLQQRRMSVAGGVGLRDSTSLRFVNEGRESRLGESLSRKLRGNASMLSSKVRDPNSSLWVLDDSEGHASESEAEKEAAEGKLFVPKADRIKVKGKTLLDKKADDQEHRQKKKAKKSNGNCTTSSGVSYTGKGGGKSAAPKPFSTMPTSSKRLLVMGSRKNMAPAAADALAYQPSPSGSNDKRSVFRPSGVYIALEKTEYLASFGPSTSSYNASPLDAMRIGDLRGYFNKGHPDLEADSIGAALRELSTYEGYLTAPTRPQTPEGYIEDLEEVLVALRTPTSPSPQSSYFKPPVSVLRIAHPAPPAPTPLAPLSPAHSKALPSQLPRVESPAPNSPGPSTAIWTQIRSPSPQLPLVQAQPFTSWMDGHNLQSPPHKLVQEQAMTSFPNIDPPSPVARVLAAPLQAMSSTVNHIQTTGVHTSSIATPFQEHVIAHVESPAMSRLKDEFMPVASVSSVPQPETEPLSERARRRVSRGESLPVIANGRPPRAYSQNVPSPSKTLSVGDPYSVRSDGRRGNTLAGLLQPPQPPMTGHTRSPLHPHSEPLYPVGDGSASKVRRASVLRPEYYDASNLGALPMPPQLPDFSVSVRRMEQTFPPKIQNSSLDLLCQAGFGDTLFTGTQKSTSKMQAPYPVYIGPNRSLDGQILPPPDVPTQRYVAMSASSLMMARLVAQRTTVDHSGSLKFSYHNKLLAHSAGAAALLGGTNRMTANKVASSSLDSLARVQYHPENLLPPITIK